MSKRALLARAFAAVMITAIVSAAASLFVILSIHLITAADNAESASSTAQVVAFSMALLLWLLGIFWAQIYSFPAALLLGFLIELPKSWWLSQREGYVWLHTVSSVVFAMLLSVVFPNLTEELLNIEYATFLAQSRFVNLTIFAFGGIFSAMFWWGIVVIPWRHSRVRAESNHPSQP